MSYSPLFDDSSFPKAIDPGRPVGSIDGSAGVTPNGGASYTIPVKCPPGTQGMVPSVSVSYCSQAGNGLLGQGWNLDGLSVISRRGQDLYHDAAVAAVSYTNNDAFVIDGNRLSVSSGANGASEATYRSETEDYATVTSYGNIGGPQYFRVVTKEGNILEYGNTADSRLMSDDNSVVMMWRLNRMQDMNGNYLTFTYGLSDRESYIQEIAYTGNVNTGLLPYNKITFQYLQRDDQNTCYDGNGYTLKSKLLLSKIQVTGEGSVFKIWQFDYGKNAQGCSFLRMVEEFAGDGSRLNDTRFKYGNSVNNFTVTETNIELPAHTPYSSPGYNYDYAESLNSGDLDGDGTADIYIQTVRTLNDDHGINPSVSNIAVTAYKATGYGALNYNSTPVTAYTVTHEPRTIPVITTFRELLTARDYNGDGRDDIFCYKVDGTQLGARTLFLANPSGTSLAFDASAVPAIVNPAPYTSGQRLAANFNLQGDFDGDGALDFINIIKDAAGQPLATISFPQKGWYNMVIADNTLAHTPSAALAALLADPDVCQVIDYDGDGRSDLLTYIKATKELKVYRLDRMAHGKYYPTRISPIISVSCDELVPGDFNGDGKTDVLYYSKLARAPMGILYNTGNGFTAVAPGITFSPADCTAGSTGSPSDRVYVADFNGDGKSDILVMKRDCANYLAHTYFNLYYSNDAGAFSLQSQELADAPDNWVQPLLADVTGDGAVDFVYKSAGSRKLKVISFPERLRGNLLTQVTDGFNRTTAFSYEPLTKGTGSGAGDFYKKGSGETYPVNNVQPAIYVVTSVQAPDGIGGVQRTRYKYENFRAHLAGRGGLGFEQTSIYQDQADTRTEQVSGLNRDFYVPYPLVSKLYQNSTGVLLKQTDVSLQFTRIGSGYCFKQQQLQSIRRDYMLGVTSITDDTCDAYGNITESNTVASGGPEVLRQNTRAAFVSTGTSAIPNKASEVTTTQQRGVKDPAGSRTAYTYDATGRVSETTQYPDAAGTDYIKDLYTYDAYGNVTNTRKRYTGSLAANEPCRAFGYDSKGRFAVSETNTLGDQRSGTIHPLWGQPVSTIDYNGLGSSYTYDAWGNCSTRTLPVAGGSYTLKQSQGWDISGTQLYYTLVTDPSAPDTKTWYDLLGRPVRVQCETFGGNWTTATTSYDSKGNIAASTQPYLSSEAPVVTTCTYDARNRLSSSSDAYGTTSYMYTESAGQSIVTKILPDGKIQQQATDVAGKLLRSGRGAAGTVHYTYDSRDNETYSQVGEWAVPYNSLITRVYNGRGQLKQLQDPDAGTINYEYDLLGRLKAQTDPNGRRTEWEYDISDRPLKKTLDAYSTVYDYYGKDKDYRLRQELVNSPAEGAITDYYEYAAGGGQTLQRRTTSAGLLEKNCTYDAYNRLLSSNYTNSGLRTTREYDANGFLVKITASAPGLPDKTMYKAGAYNGMGQLTAFSRADAKSARIDYDKGFPVRYTTPGVQDLSMDYDPANGNLLSRYDNIARTSERFTYDAADRFSNSNASWDKAGTSLSWPALHVTYDPGIGFSRGQIHAKSDAGTYGYKTFPRNAVASITPAAPEIISHETQDISYTPYDRTARITETIDGQPYEEQFIYDARAQRTLSRQYRRGVLQREKLYMGDYEGETRPGAPIRQLHYIGGDAGLCGIVLKEGSSFRFYSVYTDQLGSVTALTDESGATIARQSYDAWGRERNPDTWDYDMTWAAPKPIWLSRGYTGHEMLPEYGLINMNARMYDPLNGRMLRPDNYVQEPGNSQSYNRYAYCVNNPLKYTDPDGNFFAGTLLTSVIDFWHTGFSGGFDITKGFDRMSQAWAKFDPSRPGSKTNFAFEIDKGMFQSDKDLNFIQRVWQVGSRFTFWEGPQSLIGKIISHVNNISGNVRSVNYFHGATVLDVKHLTGAYGKTTANYIRIREYEGITYDFAGTLTKYSSVLIHEYGHYLQSRKFGAIGYGIGALNSLNHPKEDDPEAWFERDASLRGIEYFRNKVNNIESFGIGTSWNYYLPKNMRDYGWMSGIAAPFLWGINGLFNL